MNHLSNNFSENFQISRNPKLLALKLLDTKKPTKNTKWLVTSTTPRLHRSHDSSYSSAVVSLVDDLIACRSTSGAAYCSVKHGVVRPRLAGFIRAKPKSTNRISASSASLSYSRFYRTCIWVTKLFLSSLTSPKISKTQASDAENSHQCGIEKLPNLIQIQITQANLMKK